jgi:cell division protein DivIC
MYWLSYSLLCGCCSLIITLILSTRYWISKLKKLEGNKQYYIQEIKKDTTAIKQLNNPDQIEKYAREKYYMKRDNEDIYIIEFEEDVPEEEARSL